MPVNANYFVTKISFASLWHQKNGPQPQNRLQPKNGLQPQNSRQPKNGLQPQKSRRPKSGRLLYLESDSACVFFFGGRMSPNLTNFALLEFDI